MFRKIKEKREQRKRELFYKEGFKEGSNDILILLSVEPVTIFSNAHEVMDRMTDYMISFRESETKCHSGNPEMIKAFMSGYNTAVVKMGIVIKLNMSEKIEKKTCTE